jgi:hypothetical protein
MEGAISKSRTTAPRWARASAVWVCLWMLEMLVSSWRSRLRTLLVHRDELQMRCTPSRDRRPVDWPRDARQMYKALGQIFGQRANGGCRTGGHHG